MAATEETVTEHDLEIASSFYPVLVDCAREHERISYSELIKRAQDRFPNSAAVQNAIPVSTGRRLDVVRMILTREGLPDLTSLVINKNTKEVGSGFQGNPQKVRSEVAAFDWSRVTPEFELHLSGLRKAIQERNRPKRTREDALAQMSAYYQAHRAKFPKSIVAERERIVGLICNGVDVDEAFQRVL